MKVARIMLVVALALATTTFAVACSSSTQTQDANASTQQQGTPTPDQTVNVPQLDQEQAMTAPKVVEKVAPSVVRVQTEFATMGIFGQPQPQQGVGTGVIIDKEGHIVTNNHVVTGQNRNQPAQNISVTLSNGKTLDATIVGRDPATDLAVIKIDASDLTPASFANADNLVVGQDVLAIGFALDLTGGPSVTRGVISAKNRTIEESSVSVPDAIQTDASINPGNSGGPLVTAKGEIAGINTAIIQGAQNVGFSISAALVQPITQELIKNGNVTRGFIGIGTVALNPAIARQLNTDLEQGIVVTAVGQGTPAADAGLQQRDIIVQVAGQDVSNTGELLQILAQHGPGDTVSVTFYRNGEKMSVDVKLAQRPDNAG